MKTILALSILSLLSQPAFADCSSEIQTQEAKLKSAASSLETAYQDALRNFVPPEKQAEFVTLLKTAESAQGRERTVMVKMVDQVGFPPAFNDIVTNLKAIPATGEMLDYFVVDVQQAASNIGLCQNDCLKQLVSQANAIDQKMTDAIHSAKAIFLENALKPISSTDSTPQLKVFAKKLAEQEIQVDSTYGSVLILNKTVTGSNDSEVTVSVSQSSSLVNADAKAIFGESVSLSTAAKTMVSAACREQN